MPTFPSQEWVEEFCACFVEHPHAEEAAQALQGTYRFVIEAAGPLAERHVYHVAIGPDGDGGAAAALVDPPERSRLELRTDYANWRKLLTGQLDVGMAVMLRRLKVGGDLSTLTRNLSSARPLTDALRAVDTQWLDA